MVDPSTLTLEFGCSIVSLLADATPPDAGKQSLEESDKTDKDAPREDVDHMFERYRETVSMGVGLPKNLERARFPRADGDWPSSARRRSLSARPTPSAGTKVGLSDPDGAEWKGRRSMDKGYSRDNRGDLPQELTTARKVCFSRCRLLFEVRSMFQGWAIRPLKRTWWVRT
ncbi:hypothetical protein HAX54_019306 [Datura stramonium]|uniref:Uncharacterized protein n=1 Tax=Datura stramonium TaxID=4076 RepID=A0ABS8UNW2_DATST|nr:hypothetical protein [Datura stramonium]